MRPIRLLPASTPLEPGGLTGFAQLVPVVTLAPGFAAVEHHIDGQAVVVVTAAALDPGDLLAGLGAALGVQVILSRDAAQALEHPHLDAAFVGLLDERERF